VHTKVLLKKLVDTADIVRDQEVTTVDIMREEWMQAPNRGLTERSGEVFLRDIPSHSILSHWISEVRIFHTNFEGVKFLNVPLN
jgi:hypothetical protein